MSFEIYSICTRVASIDTRRMNKKGPRHLRLQGMRDRARRPGDRRLPGAPTPPSRPSPTVRNVSRSLVGPTARADYPLRMRPASRLSVVVLIALLLAAGVGAAAVLAGSTEPATAPSCSETCAPQLTPVPGHQAHLAATRRRRLPGPRAMHAPRRSNDDTR
jgi:hypothetical protein